jgi:hypothetical protein
MTKDEALKQALEALENFADVVKYDNEQDYIGCRACCYVLAYDQHSENCQATKAITAIKAALAQPEQEPVAFAGVEMWIGNTRTKKLMTQTELHFAIDPWAIVKFNSDSCIDALKQLNT